MRTDLNSNSHDRKKVVIISNVSEYQFTVSLIKARDNFKLGEMLVHKSENDENAWNPHINLIDTARGKGFGAMLFDIVIEYITNYKHSQIVPPRSAASGKFTATPAAQRLYKYYYINRSDVQKHKISAKSIDHTFMQNNIWMYTGYTKSLNLIPKFLGTASLIIK